MDPLEYKRGEIYMADLDPATGSEQGGIRPVLIIQNNTGNRFSPTVIAVPITSRKKNDQPTHVQLGNNYGLPKDSLLFAEQPRTLDKSRLRERMGQVDCSAMERINRALRISMGIPPCSPYTITLCRQCAALFYASHSHKIKRIDRYAKKRDRCDFCCKRRGFDYLITDVITNYGKQGQLL